MIRASGDAAAKYLVLSVVIKNTSFAAVTNCTSPDSGAEGGTVAVHLRNRAAQRTYDGGAAGTMPPLLLLQFLAKSE